MDKKEKEQKKEYIKTSINLANGRFKDEEINALYNLVENKSSYDQRSKTYESTYDGWCSDGKYTRKEKATYTFSDAKDGIQIEEYREFHDDDGTEGTSLSYYKTGREILNVMDKLF